MIAGFNVRPGLAVIAEGRRYEVEQVVDLENILARDVETGDIRRLRFIQLVPASPLQPDEQMAPAAPDPQQVTETGWQRAQVRFAAIRPLIEQGTYTRREVQARAEYTGYATATLYPDFDTSRYILAGNRERGLLSYKTLWFSSLDT
jgi:putative transposase